MATKRTCIKTKKVNSPATGHRVERCAKFSPTRSPRRSPKKASPKRASPKRSPARRAPTKWNKFVKAHAGKGHSPAQLAAMYAKQR